MYTPGLQNLLIEMSLESTVRGSPSKKLSPLTHLLSRTWSSFLALTSCEDFPFLFPGDPMKESLQPLLYLILVSSFFTPVISPLLIMTMGKLYFLTFSIFWAASLPHKVWSHSLTYPQIFFLSSVNLVVLMSLTHSLSLLDHVAVGLGAMDMWRKTEYPIISSEEKEIVVKKYTGKWTLVLWFF